MKEQTRIKLTELIYTMSQNSEHIDGWKHIELTFAVNHIVSLNWPNFMLKIVSFKMPQNWDGSLEKAEQIEALDALYVDKNDVIHWKTKANAETEMWDDRQRAFVVDVVDQFLAGEWTPPWKCGSCTSRHNGTIKPEW